MMLRRFASVPPPPTVLQQSHLPSLDGLRGLSILFVLTGHCFGDPEPFFSGGFGVAIFFVISGFLITLLLLKEKYQTGTISLSRFYVRRFLRIFPVAYLFLFVLVILNWWFDIQMPVAAFLSAALYLRDTTIFGINPIDYSGHFWSLSVEEQYYLLFPFFLKRSVNAYLLLIIFFIITIPAFNHFDHFSLNTIKVYHVFDEIIQFMTGILVGALFAILLYYGIISENFVKRGRLWLSLFLLFLAGFMHTNPRLFLSTGLAQTCSAILIAFLIVINLKPDGNLFYKLLNNRPMKYLGVLSYSIYIWQQIFTFNVPWKDSFPGAASLWFNLPLLGVVSYVSYNFYEKRFLNLKDKFH